jgi:carbon-monoxide dehydrogenase large subunit
MTGISPHDQGHETTFAQMVADEFGIDIDDITVLRRHRDPSTASARSAAAASHWVGPR